MKTIVAMAGMVAALVGCTVNNSNPTTAWGKQGVSMLEYRTDAGQCAVLAVTSPTDGNGAKTAGGLSGSNAGAPSQAASGSATASAGAAAGAGGGGGSANPLGGSTYRDSGSADFATRAAIQQRTEEMAQQRQRNEALKSCLASRGYTEFSLTPEQRAHLATLAQGSEERRDYLYKLGTDPQVLDKQAVKKASSPAAK
ncbi:MAG TPA: hypothetical protein VFO82_06785 [Steroidobacteraceae bacterium]|nr:hypothetical protein [Steroidobacteraceae bacterium]